MCLIACISVAGNIVALFCWQPRDRKAVTTEDPRTTWLHFRGYLPPEPTTKGHVKDGIPVSTESFFNSSDIHYYTNTMRFDFNGFSIKFALLLVKGNRRIKLMFCIFVWFSTVRCVVYALSLADYNADF